MRTIIQHDTTAHISDVPDFGIVSDVLELTDKERYSLSWLQCFITEDGQISLSDLKSWCGIKSRTNTITPEQASELARLLQGYAEMYRTPEDGKHWWDFTLEMGFTWTVAELATQAGVVVEAAEAHCRGEGWLSTIAYHRMVSAMMTTPGHNVASGGVR